MRKKVLIVEDNDLNRRLFNDLLAAEGYETLLSTGGGDAHEIALRDRPDLIVMDICLPEADGLDATRRIKRHEATKRIPVIAVTACAMEGDERRILAEGCADYLPKPISVPTFLDCVQRHLP